MKKFKKPEYVIGNNYWHRNLEKNCVFTLECFIMQYQNPDSTSVFMKFDDGEILEVCKHFIEEKHG